MTQRHKNQGTCQIQPAPEKLLDKDACVSTDPL